MKEKKEKISNLLPKLPNKPGVYKFIDKEGRVIYVGKAKDLKKRVKQYFQNKEQGVKTKKMLENTEDLDYTIVDSELEALILELNLIKELRPKYNILLKDDKNFVYIMISNEEFPRIQIVRKITDKKATYYGPKTAKHKVEKTFKILKKVSPFRHCGLEMTTEKDGSIKVTKKTIKYPCLDYYIKRCPGPCIGEITKEDYARIINQIKKFFEGHHEELLKDLKKQMQEFVSNKEFEKAGKIRDRILNIEEIAEKQKISDPNQKDKDIINYVIENNRAFFNLFQIRDGKLINQENFILQAQSLEDNEQDPEVLEAFLLQYYEKTHNIPKEILIPHEPANQEEVRTFIKNEKESSVKLLIPQKGTKNKLLSLSHKNAKIYADRNRTSWQENSKENENSVKELKKLLKLKDEPKRIECYDISHLAGTDTVGSMIVFTKGPPDKNMYRKFRVQSVQDKPDDYKSLEEVLTRRLSRLTVKIAAKDYKLKKATKKTTPEIQEILKKEKLLTKDFDKQTHYHLEDPKKKIAGTLNLLEINENIAELQGLYINPKHRGKKLGHKLITEVCLKSKAKRIYIACKKELAEYYARLGFEPIKTIPKELKNACLKCRDITGQTIWYAIEKKRLKPDASFSKIPDLIVIDGGKGQLSSATKVLKKLKIDLPVISIAKQEEEIFLPTQKPSIKLDRNSPTLKLIQRARDEAHRFAITYNRKLRNKKIT